MLSCISDGGNSPDARAAASYKIGDEFDGSDTNYLKGSVSTSEKDGVKTMQIDYESPEGTIKTKDGRISGFRYSKGENPIPDYLSPLEIGWDTGFFDCLSALQREGYSVQVDYPPFDLPYRKSNANIWATHEKDLSEKYYFHFYGDEFSDGGELSPALHSISVNANPSYYQYKNNLEYPSRGVNLLPDDRKREALAFSGLLGEQNKAQHNRLDPFPSDTTKGRMILTSSWGIEDREELLDMLISLDEGGHSQSFRDALEFLEAIPESDDPVDYVYRNENSAGRASRILYTALIKDIPGMRERTLRAWDWGRSVSLCRWGFNAGFLSEEEAWEKILAYRVKILGYYNSWEDFTANYALGRMFWNAYSSDKDGYIDKANEIFESYNRLIHTQDSIWRAPWNGSGDVSPLYSYETAFEDIPITYESTKPFQAWKRFVKGIDLYRIGSYNDARREFDQSLLLHPDFHTPPLRYLISCERKMNDPWDARWDYAERLLEILPGDYYANLALGEIYEESNDLAQGERQLEKTIRLDPQKSAAYASLARLFLKQDKYDEAKILFEHYDENVKEEKVNYYAHMLRGFLYYDLKDYDRAIDYFMRCYQSY